MAEAKTWQAPDLLLVLLIALLCGVGLVAITGATASMEGFADLWKTQARWLALGGAAVLLMLFVDYRRILKYAWWIYGITLAVTLYTALFAEETMGHSAWLMVFGRGVQVAEMMKLATILALAAYLYKRVGQLNNLTSLIVPLLIALVPMGAVLKQGDLGTSLVFLPICLAMLYAADMRGVYLLLMVSPLAALLALFEGPQWPVVFGIFLVFLFFVMRDRQVPWLDRVIFLGGNVLAYLFVIPMLWSHLEQYQKDRLLVFTNPDYDVNSAGYQLHQSMIAVGSGGFLGKGWKEGTQSGLRFLPETHTDFIFANWSEEWGFVGAVFLLGLFLLLFWRILDSGRRARDIRGSLLAAGVTALFAVHLIINIGMTIRLMPITGIPLLLISYGGSSVITALLALGFILNLRMRREIAYRY